MGKKSRRKRAQKQKKETNKNAIVVGAILLILLGAWGFSKMGDSDYPDYISGVFAEAIVSPETGKVVLPEEALAEDKMLFVDVKLDNVTEEFTYLGRNIILSTYRNAEYLPLIVYESPKGKTISGVRVCEPCSSFSFHIVDKKYLSCDACGTRWNIETLQGVSGGCMNYPPPKLTTGLANGIIIETSYTGLTVQA
jgi:hypothetical protein